MNNSIFGGYVDRLLAAGSVGIVPSTAVSNQFLTGVGSGGTVTRAQPSTANLSDYVEGTWTPVNADGAVTVTVSSAVYTKIGRIVIASCYLTWPSTAASTTIRINGLPYTVANTNAARTGYIVYCQDRTNIASALPINNTTGFQIFNSTGTNTLNSAASTLVVSVQVIYYV